MIKSFAIFLSIFTLVASLSTTANLTVDPVNSMFKDQSGRYIFIHGVNVVYKEFPYYPITHEFNQNSSLSKVDWVNLRNWGFKAIRLYLSWQGFEPEENKFNYTYLEKLRDIVRTGQQYDIGVILDVHHDLYSRKFCGEGFPDWLVTKLTFPAPFKTQLQYDDHGIPTKQSCMKTSFFKYYATYDVNQFSHAFFTNQNGMADKFIRMWRNVVSFFSGEANVIGYDLINEPSGADLWKNPYTFLGPGSNNNKFLYPFYQRLMAEIRTIDKTRLLLFEPSVADYFGGFYENPDKICPNKAVMSYHTYCPFKNQHAEPTSQTKCNIVDGYYIDSRVANIKKLKIGGMMTQFGSVPQSQSGLRQIKRVLKYAESHWQSWFYWQYKYNADSTCSSNPPWQHSFYYPDGSLQAKKVKQLTHPYAIAVCGSPLSQSYTENSYILSFKPKRCNDKHTQIYLNQEYYFNEQFGIIFEPACNACSLKSLSKGVYQVIVSDKVLYNKLTVKVAKHI